MRSMMREGAQDWLATLDKFAIAYTDCVTDEGRAAIVADAYPYHISEADLIHYGPGAKRKAQG